MAMMKPIAPFKTTDHMIELGRVQLASSTSSAGYGYQHTSVTLEVKDITNTYGQRSQTPIKNPWA